MTVHTPITTTTVVSAPDPGTSGISAAPADHSTQELTRWLIHQVAIYLDCPPEEIDPSVALAEYGLDSVSALSLCGDIEDAFDLVLEPTVAWDYPTLDSLAELLVTELAAAGGS